MQTKKKKQSQDDIILQYLKKGKSITTFEAFTLFGIVDLQSVVRNIRKKITVKDKWVKSINHLGKPVRFKRYFLEIA